MQHLHSLLSHSLLDNSNGSSSTTTGHAHARKVIAQGQLVCSCSILFRAKQTGFLIFGIKRKVKAKKTAYYVSPLRAAERKAHSILRRTLPLAQNKKRVHVQSLVWRKINKQQRNTKKNVAALSVCVCVCVCVHYIINKYIRIQLCIYAYKYLLCCSVRYADIVAFSCCSPPPPHSAPVFVCALVRKK